MESRGNVIMKGKKKQQGKIDQLNCWKAIMSIADICHHRRWYIFFQASALFLRREREILAHFVAKIRTCWCTFTGVNDRKVSQN